MKQNLTKILALFIFITGIITFVLFQSGYLLNDNEVGYQTSHNGGAVVSNKKDSVYQRKQDSVRRRIISSSKTVITDERIFEKFVNSRFDTTMKKVDKIQTSTILPGSKTIIPRKAPLKITDPPIIDTIRLYKSNSKLHY